MILQDAGIIQGEYKTMNTITSVKIPVKSLENVHELEAKAEKNPDVKETLYFFNSEAEQEREKGYFEIIQTGM